MRRSSTKNQPLLQAKLHEFYQLAESEAAAAKDVAAIVPPSAAQLPAAKKRKPSAKNQPEKVRKRNDS
jgi:septation ring formation regulator EzrA